MKVFQPAFYAREDMRLPLYATFANVVVNVALSLALFPRMGPAGIGMATSAAGWLNAAILGAVATSRGLFLPEPRTVRTTVAIALGALLMGGLIWYAATAGAPLMALGFAAKALFVAVLVGAGAVVHFAVVAVVGGVGPAEIKGALRRG